MRDDVRQLSVTYLNALKDHGPTPKGVLWPNAEDLIKRFSVLLDFMPFSDYDESNRLRLLDVGCGPGLLLDYLHKVGLDNKVDYVGVDVIPDSIRVAQKRYPRRRFECIDLRDHQTELCDFHYAVICGVFCGRFTITKDAMESLARELTTAVWPLVSRGLIFSFMSSHVDWERDDLFHWKLDEVMSFCKSHLSRHVIMRLDYGLWEVSVCVKKHSSSAMLAVPESW